MRRVANSSAATAWIMRLTFFIYIVFLLGPVAGLKPSTLGWWGKWPTTQLWLLALCLYFFLLSFFASNVSGTTQTLNDDEASGQPLCCDFWHHVSNFFYWYCFSPGTSSRTQTLNFGMMRRVANCSAAIVGIMNVFFFFDHFLHPMSVAQLKINLGMANHSALTVGLMLLTFSIDIVFLLGPAAGLEPSTLGW